MKLHANTFDMVDLDDFQFLTGWTLVNLILSNYYWNCSLTNFTLTRLSPTNVHDGKNDLQTIDFFVFSN